jgi:hypothetical protein
MHLQSVWIIILRLPELAALSKDVTSSTVVLVTALAVSMPDEPMLFAKLLVMLPMNKLHYLMPYK